MRARERRAGLRRVTVIGGGISGLSAAHELVERGFDVQLLECRTRREPDGQLCVELGGLARSQYSFIPRAPTRGTLDGAAAGTLPLQASHALGSDRVTSLRFVADSAELTAGAERALEALLPRLLGPWQRYDIELCPAPRAARAWPEDATAAAAEAALAGARVARLREALIAGGVDAQRLSAGAASPDSPPASAARAPAPAGDVELRLAAALAPGEHGFRFVPATYRHLHDTLRRIPLLDATGSATHRTVDDRLIAVETQWLARRTGTSIELRRDRRVPLPALAAWVTELGYSARDAALMFLRLLRFATSCPGRRAVEAEELSFWDYCTLRQLARAPGTQPCPERLPYSAPFLDYLQHLPRALVAMDALHADARTQANMYLQLVRDQLQPGERIDAVFDAPTSEAWFVPWRQYLQRAGVRFFAGRLSSLEPRPASGCDAPELVPGFEPTAPGGLDGFDVDADYFVIAVDLVAAQRCSEAVARWGQATGTSVGVFGELEAFVLREPPDPLGNPGRWRDPETRAGEQPWDRLQTLSGIQYFCGHRSALTRGFGYFLDSDWALTSLTHTEHWRERWSLPTHGCLSLISVDIGDFRRPSPATGRPARSSSPDEIAREVWRQLERAAGRSDGRTRWPLPLYYHLDDYLEFGPDGSLTNRAPYLINIAGDWQRRPGPEPFQPHAPMPRDGEPGGAVWQAPHGGYWVHFGKYVFAGTYLRTYTRLTSMESANESARHAVNAILDHVASAVSGLPPLHASPANAAVPSGAGDYCPVWNPEQHEFAVLDAAKQLDAELLRRNLPHLADILELDSLGLSVDEHQQDAPLAMLRQITERLETLLDSRQLLGDPPLRQLLALVLELFEGRDD